MATHTSASLTLGPLSIQRETFDGMSGRIRDALGAGKPLRLAFCNAHTALLAMRNRTYSKTLSKMTVLNDGIGLDIAARFLDGAAFPENLNGTDFVPRLLSSLDKGARVYLLGATPQVVKRAADTISRRYPQHTIVGYRDGYFGDTETDTVIDEINKADTDILLVAMGNPLQETFIVEHSDALTCSVAIGVGALFDFLSGRVQRAPEWMQALKIEWFFRFLNEPRRLFRRYFIGIPLFLFAIGTYRLRNGGDIA